MAVINLPTIDLRQRLEQEPYRFEFFQAVRILSWLAHTLPETDFHHGRKPIGHDAAPSREIVRFRSHLSHSFPQGSVSGFRWRDSKPETPPELTTAFLGLTGPNGVLPRHYTQLLIDRVRDRDTAMRDFFDVFNHRTISHFFRAWAKYRMPIAFEESKLDREKRGQEDQFTTCLYAYVGLGTGGLRNRLALPDATFMYYAGHYAQRRPNAISLEAMVADFFRVTTNIVQFVGQWLYLDRTDQSRLDVATRLSGSSLNNVLGHNVVVGRRVWGIENRFRVRLGPLHYRQFVQYLPTGTLLCRLAQFVRMYVGPEFDFDAQLVLHREDVPMCQLDSAAAVAPRLGWNTWLHNQPFEEHAEDATFAVEGSPQGP